MYSRIKLILWGMFHGLVAFLILGWLAPQWQGNWRALAVIVAIGATLSAIVFGIGHNSRPRTQKWRFLATSSFLPPIVVIGADSVYYGRPYFAGPLTLGFIILWVILLLPFALGAAFALKKVSESSKGRDPDL